MKTTTTINGKPVIETPARNILNLESGFKKKLLCDGPTFSLGTACVYSCQFCYVPPLMQNVPAIRAAMTALNVPFDGLVVRRNGALQSLRNQLLTPKGAPRYPDPSDNRVVYSSPLVDVAATVELAKETLDACLLILELTHWQIRLLSKSNLLPLIAERIPGQHSHRMIYGVSTGTLNDKLALAFEQGTPLPSKRIASLHRLQDAGMRTFGMICPSLPQRDYNRFAEETLAAVRADRCEHVWAEVINVRGESMTRTVNALRDAGFVWDADALKSVSTDKEAWEEYSRQTFLGHIEHCPAGKLRFLQYVTKANRSWWDGRDGAVLL